MAITIYHNPRCSKSRQTLALLMERDLDPTVIEYLTQTPDVQTLQSIVTKLNFSARDLMRTGEQAYKENKLDSEDLTEQQLLEAMVKYPILIERPIVINGDKATIGRPPENVLEII